MIASANAAPQASNCVNVLTNLRGDITIGYQFGGHTAGPSVLVVGFSPVAGSVFERLLLLPTLGWLRGELTLLDLSALEAAGENSRLVPFLQAASEGVQFLPYASLARGNGDVSRPVDDGYWKVLRHCAELAMISGRGVFGEERPS